MHARPKALKWIVVRAQAQQANAMGYSYIYCCVEERCFAQRQNIMAGVVIKLLDMSRSAHRRRDDRVRYDIYVPPSLFNL